MTDTSVLLEVCSRNVLVTHGTGLAGHVGFHKVVAVTFGEYYTVTEVTRNFSGRGILQFSIELAVTSELLRELRLCTITNLAVLTEDNCRDFFVTL